MKLNPATKMRNDTQSPNKVNDERKDDVLVGDDMDLSLATSVSLSPESILRNVMDNQEAQADKKIADGLNRHVFVSTMQDSSMHIHACNTISRYCYPPTGLTTVFPIHL